MSRLICWIRGHAWKKDHECTVLCEHLFGMNRKSKHCARCGEYKP